MNGYKCTIESTTKELTSARERIMFKDTTNAIKLDDVVAPESPLVINFSMLVKLAIENPMATEDKEYSRYILVDTNGTKYMTGSKTLISALESIIDEMVQEFENPQEVEFELEIYKVPSKNYTNKHFLSCSLV